MAVNDSMKVDFLWKKVVYGVTNTAIGSKAAPNEAIGSPTNVYNDSIWAESSLIPAPAASGPVVQAYTGINRLQLVPDPSVGGNKAWLCMESIGADVNDSSLRLKNWIPFSLDPSYLVKFYATDPALGSPASLNGLADNNEWVFDHLAGTLQFVNDVPSSVLSSGTLFMEGYRYTGLVGVGSTSSSDSYIMKTYTGATQTGSYTWTGFFNSVPSTGVAVFFNGLAVDDNDFSVAGVDLTLNLTAIGYDLEDGDELGYRSA